MGTVSIMVVVMSGSVKDVMSMTPGFIVLTRVLVVEHFISTMIPTMNMSVEILVVFVLNMQAV